MSDERNESVDLSHVDSRGRAQMVDVSSKSVTSRTAIASAEVSIRGDVLDALMAGELAKGDALVTARVAGIATAKRTSEWIPLCHTLGLDWVSIEFERTAKDRLRILCSTKTSSRTGVEMEALTGAAAAALCIYDMAKAGDKSIVVGPIQLEHKSGGRSGSYDRV